MRARTLLALILSQVQVNNATVLCAYYTSCKLDDIPCKHTVSLIHIVADEWAVCVRGYNSTYSIVTIVIWKIEFSFFFFFFYNKMNVFI